MTDKSPTAAGAIVALGTIGGAIVGGVLHQASAGLLIGLIAGSAIAILLWLRERRRIGR